MEKNNPFFIKLRLFLPISLIIFIVVVSTTIWSVRKSMQSINKQIENTLLLEVQTILKMFERERMLKLEKVQSNYAVASYLFKQRKLKITDDTLHLIIENQNTHLAHNTFLHQWFLDNKPLIGDSAFVDSLYDLIGGTITIFQKSDSGYVRIATNVRKEDGMRALGTFIPHDSPVVKAIETGQIYFGRAFVVNDWYITAYAPIYKNNTIVGMFYVGDKEKDLLELNKIISELKIGKSGYPYVFDKDGYLLIHPEREGAFWGDSILFQQIHHKEEGLIRYRYNNKSKTMAFKYFAPFELYIAASVYNDIETRDLKTSTILGGVVTAFTAILLLLVFIYYLTTERIFRFFTEMQQSKKKLITIKQALEESEERFQKLFDSTGDDIFVTDINENIVEVNEATCKTLGYTKEELLKMKITEIKSPKYVDKVSYNRHMIYEKGNFIFESEHVTKDGRIIPVEFISRLVSYKNEKLILSVVRDMSQRREMERKILSAVIQAEEKERERFAKDMHDGLGPLLSTIKLYVNELNSEGLPPEERNELTQLSNELLDEAVNATRTISNNLMPRIINMYGLVKAVEDFCNKINKTNKLRIEFEYEYLEERLNHDMELILFRVISELINNTLKHAQAKTAMILLFKREERISLYYKDDGIGFNTDEVVNNMQGGMGIKNIISRIKSINGTYNFSSSKDHGFSIKIEIQI